MDWIELLLSASFWVAAVRIASPLIFGTLGELLCERAGVLNLGIVEYMEGFEGSGQCDALTGLLDPFGTFDRCRDVTPYETG